MSALVSLSNTPAQPSASASVLLRPASVFDGQQLRSGWVVVVTGDRIAAAGPADEISAPPNARAIDIVSVAGDPTREVAALCRIRLVMKGGIVFREPDQPAR